MTVGLLNQEVQERWLIAHRGAVKSELIKQLVDADNDLRWAAQTPFPPTQEQLGQMHNVAALKGLVLTKFITRSRINAEEWLRRNA